MVILRYTCTYILLRYLSTVTVIANYRFLLGYLPTVILWSTDLYLPEALLLCLGLLLLQFLPQILERLVHLTQQVVHGPLHLVCRHVRCLCEQGEKGIKIGYSRERDTHRHRETEGQTDRHTLKQKETEQETIHLFEQGEKQLLVEKERGNMGKIEEGEHIKEEKERQMWKQERRLDVK